MPLNTEQRKQKIRKFITFLKENKDDIAVEELNEILDEMCLVAYNSLSNKNLLKYKAHHKNINLCKFSEFYSFRHTINGFKIFSIVFLT